MEREGKKNEKQNDSESQTLSSVTLSLALPSPVISRPGADGHSSTHYPVGVEEVGKCSHVNKSGCP